MPKLDKQDVNLKEVLRQASKARQSQGKRIADIFGTKKAPNVTDETLERFLAYLKENLEMPCQVTGIEDMGCFAWEEYYTFGTGSEKEYEQLKKKKASYRDTYELLNFEEDYDDNYGLSVKVRRVSDKKRFVLPLSDLKATEEASPNYQLLDDYSTWFVNWR